MDSHGQNDIAQSQSFYQAFMNICSIILVQFSTLFYITTINYLLTILCKFKPRSGHMKHLSSLYMCYFIYGFT